jgi:hypothetical protein
VCGAAVQNLFCCNIQPVFPDFPSEWSATVEANIVEKGYTYVQHEYYSQSQACVDRQPDEQMRASESN